MRIIQAHDEHVHPAMDLLSDCIRDLRRHGINQWDDIYPNLDTVTKDVAGRTLYVALQENRCLGAVCLTEEQAAAYREVSWVGGEPAFVIHRLCVAPAQQGRGILSRMVDFAEGFAEEKGYASIRLDAYTGNERAVRLYERRGYTVAAQVFFPRRRLPFYCMEKLLRNVNAA